MPDVTEAERKNAEIAPLDPATAALRLFWWKKKPNFGDDLSRHVFAHFAGRPVVWAAERDADAFAIGSIAQKILKAHRAPREGRLPVVWGSGMLGPVPARLHEVAEIRALRGPLSATILGLRGIPLGDPGLFAADLDLEWPERKDRIGLIAHINQGIAGSEAKKFGAAGFMIIKAAQSAPAVLRAIASCRHIYSSSLHGLVVADSLGIPNTWVAGPGIHETPEFKFYDYGLAIGRAFPQAIPIDAVLEHAKTLDAAAERELPYAEGIARAKAAVAAAFPAEMRTGGAP